MKSANDVGKAFDREAIRAQLKSFGATWLRWKQHGCDWCRTTLTQEDVDAYVDWCMEIGKLVPGDQPLPKPWVFCRDCAGGAILELIDGVQFSPSARPSTEPQDPWSRPKWSPDEGQRERYP